MAERKYLITEEEMKRYEVLQKVLLGQINLRKAQELLGLSYRQTLRIKKRFVVEGFEGLLRKQPQRPPNLKLTEALKEEIIKLRMSLYWDFNILHFKDKLKEDHNIQFSYETIRRLLIKEDLHKPGRKRRFYRRRRRMPMAGMLVQMDSSEHRWIEAVSEPWWLVTMIDDADGSVYAEFHPSETVRANMSVIKKYIEKRGIFMALYTDRASHFRTTRHGGLHYQVEVEQKETQIERALKELGITLINANTPQAKGRIERRFRFFQDRLIKEMRLRRINNYDEANRFLQEEFLPWCNNKYTQKVESVYKPLTEGKDLELIFSIRHPRKVNKDNTVKYCGAVYQLLPMNGTRTYAGKWVEICELSDVKIEILLEGKRIPYVEIEEKERIKRQSKDEEILSSRIYFEDKTKKYIPPPSHPWRRGWKRSVTFQISNDV